MGARLFDQFWLGLREARWLTAQRAAAYLTLFLIVSLLSMAGWAIAGAFTPTLKRLGADFPSFWAASKLALSGAPEAAWNIAEHHRIQANINGTDGKYYAFFYPPPYLLLCYPLALLSYPFGLLTWVGATTFAYARAITVYAKGAVPWLAALGFPAVTINAAHGQNAALSTALFAAGLHQLDRRPVLAGACLGALIWKPHLGVLIPVSLIAARRWTAFVSAGATAAALLALSALVLGAESWSAFLTVSPIARLTLEQGLVGDEKMQSVFAGARLMGAGVNLAWAAQVCATVAAAGLIVFTHWRRPRPHIEGPVLVAATLLATPFLLDYDLLLLAIPLAWLVRQGAAAGFLPWERMLIFAACLTPLVSRLFAGALGVPLAPVLVTCLVAVLLRRELHPLAAQPTRAASMQARTA